MASVRTPENVTLLASAARTASENSDDQYNFGHRGMHLIIDATAAADTPSVVFTIQGLDPTSGKYYDILESAAITGTGTTRLTVFDGATAASNTIANDFLPAIWRVEAVAADADSLTYSVGASLLP